MTSIEPFPIPEAYQAYLKPTSRTRDLRTDDEILTNLSKFRAVTSEKNVWGFWDTGLGNMRPWLKRNVVQWTRKNEADGWTVRILDSVPSSPNNALNYIPADMLPNAYVEGTMDGQFKGQHSADFMRGALLYLYGGAYLDVSIILFQTLDDLIWKKLVDDSNPYRVAGPFAFASVIINFSVFARKGDPFIRRWHDLFMHVWEGRTNPDGLRFHPLLKPWFDVTLQHFETNGLGPIGKLKPGLNLDTAAEYGTQVICWSRIASVREPDGFDGAEYWQNNILVWNMATENALAEILCKADGRKIFKLLMSDRGEETKSKKPEEWAEAHELVWSLLSKSVFMKVPKAAGFTDGICLGNLMDTAENNGGEDARKGTWFEWLRIGVEEFDQTREVDFVEQPAQVTVVVKGHLEA